MNKFVTILRVIGGLSLLVSLISLFIEQRDIAIYSIGISLFIAAIVFALQIGNYYHSFTMKRRREN